MRSKEITVRSCVPEGKGEIEKLVTKHILYAELYNIQPSLFPGLVINVLALRHAVACNTTDK